MFRYGPLHAEDESPDSHGRRRALTIFRQSEHGVLVIAGKLQEDSGNKGTADITRLDYFTGQRISFGDWDSIWRYFEGSEFAHLMQEIRDRIGRIERGDTLLDPVRRCQTNPGNI